MEERKKKNTIVTTVRIIAVILGMMTILAAVPPLYLVISNAVRWNEDREEGLEKISRFHEALIKQSKERDRRLFNPRDPTGNSFPTRIFDRNGVIIGEYVPKLYEIIYIEDIDPKLKSMIILMEDQQFYRHPGINPLRMAALMVKSIMKGEILGGGSTISQQLAKNHLTKFNEEKTLMEKLRRKLYEIFATLDIEARYSKDEILAMYVNTAYLGPFSDGFEAASHYYFNKPLRRLRLVEQAVLVSMLPNALYYSPIKNPERNKKKVKRILNRMKGHGYINEAVISNEMQYYNENFGSNFAKRKDTAQRKMKINRAPYFNEYVRQKLAAVFEMQEIVNGSLKIETTLDVKHYTLAEREIRRTLITLKEEASNTNTYEAAVVSLDPKSGAIINMIGGSGYSRENEFNRASSGRRQIGSLVKPFIYAYAFEEGYFPSSIIEDKPYSYNAGRGNKWTPKNYNNEYRGDVLLEDALRKSINTVAVQLLYRIGFSEFRKNVLEIIPRGARIPNNLTFALGTIELSPLNVAQMYTVFANYGKMSYPYAIERVLDKHGKEITPAKLKPKRPKEIYTLSESSIYFVNSTLRKVLKPGGTGYYAVYKTGMQYPLSGKSGTTDRGADAWFAAFYEKMTTVCWVGSDDYIAPLPKGSTGGRVAATTLFRYLKTALKNERPEEFELYKPTTIQTVDICLDSGRAAVQGCTNTMTIEVCGMDTNDTCPIHNEGMDNKTAEEDYGF